MPRRMSLASIEAQIEALQQKAAAIKSAEVDGVIKRIKVAIDHYGLTAEDLGFTSSRGPKAPRAEAGRSAAKQTQRALSKRTAGKRAKPKAPPVAKYVDGAGNSWTGHGKRPNWFKAAIESGKTAEELLVQAPATT